MARGAVVVLLLALVAVQHVDAAYNAVAGYNAMAAALKKAKLNAYLNQLVNSNFSGTLKSILPKYQVTLLAPTDAAFKAFPSFATYKAKRIMMFQLIAYNMLGNIWTYKNFQKATVGTLFSTGNDKDTMQKLKSKANVVILGKPGATAGVVIPPTTVYKDAQVIVYAVPKVISPFA
eukprot:TRINITY_DN652_c0_g1_i1.p1 TRINITY_DN652_c0_g1~~TRINITY_DN652_c0_g1_i1.p1  ORF type:complete len:176 (-),score=35.98 TRINITY_DN652_c0_g1_i1:252-779(-)